MSSIGTLESIISIRNMNDDMNDVMNDVYLDPMNDLIHDLGFE